MTSEALGYLNTCFETIQIPYQFMEWTSTPVPSTYWVGEYTETESVNEDGLEEATFILTGTTNGTYLSLETVRESLKAYFKDGKTAILTSGSGIAVFYSDAYPVPSVEEGVRRMQINLKIKEWRI